MASRIYVKDKEDFLKYYNQENSEISDYVAYRIVGDKVHIKVLIPMNEQMVRETILKIKD